MKTVTTTTVIKLSGEAIIELLRQSGQTVPDNASVTLRVGYGEAYDVNESTPVMIEWSECDED